MGIFSHFLEVSCNFTGHEAPRKWSKLQTNIKNVFRDIKLTLGNLGSGQHLWQFWKNGSFHFYPQIPPVKKNSHIFRGKSIFPVFIEKIFPQYFAQEKKCHLPPPPGHGFIFWWPHYWPHPPKTQKIWWPLVTSRNPLFEKIRWPLVTSTSKKAMHLVILVTHQVSKTQIFSLKYTAEFT